MNGAFNDEFRQKAFKCCVNHFIRTTGSWKRGALGNLYYHPFYNYCCYVVSDWLTSF